MKNGSSVGRKLLTCGVALVAAATLSSHAKASCEGFLEMTESTSVGVSYRKDPQTGLPNAFMMMGEAAFVAPTSSLIRTAKQKAFARAKAEFQRFMKEDFSAEQLFSDLQNSVINTNSDGTTSGSAEELSSITETMKNNTQGVLSGIVALAECVDTKERKAMVYAGWKPEMSAAAADAKQTIRSEVARGDAPVSANATAGGNAATQTTRPLQKIQPAQGYSAKSKNLSDF